MVVDPAVREHGMTTAEYAVGTLGACTIAGMLVTVAQGDWFQGLLQDVFRTALDPLAFLRLVQGHVPFSPLR